MSTLQLVSVDRLAVDPLNAVWPKKGMFLVLGLVLGCCLGVVVALLRHVAQAHIHQMARIEVAPCLGLWARRAV